MGRRKNRNRVPPRPRRSSAAGPRTVAYHSCFIEDDLPSIDVFTTHVRQYATLIPGDFLEFHDFAPGTPKVVAVEELLPATR